MKLWRWMVVFVYGKYLSYIGRQFIKGKISYDVLITKSDRAMLLADKLYQAKEGGS